MKKIKLILFKFLSLLIFAFTLQNGFAINSNDINSKAATIACNDTVQISMDLECESIVRPDQLLEGDYPDMSIFTVNIIDQNGVSIGDALDKSHVGYILVAEVIDTDTKNKCWSRIEVVDKSAPILECNEFYTTCFNDNPTPGEYLPHNYRFAYKPNADIPDNDTLKLDLVVGEIPGATITDLDVVLKIQHPNLIDLEAFIVSPTNDTINLFENLSCGSANMEVVIDDEASKTSAELSSDCTPYDPAIDCDYQPVDLLSIIDGISPTGTWVLNIIDKNAGNTGVLDYAALLFKQNNGYANFPIPAGASTPVNIGENKYEVASGVDPCGKTILSYVDSIENLDCSTNYTSIRHRTWTAEDESGNKSTCTQDIYVIRTGTAFLEFPKNRDNIALPALSCTNPNGFTGEPGSELCNMVTISHKDDTINICSGSYKVIRHWRVSEMCSDEVIEHDQVIAVMDTEGPVLSDLDDEDLEASSLECSRDINLTFPNIISDCSDYDLMTYTIGYQILNASGDPTTDHLLTKNLVKTSATTYTLIGADIGKVKITYTITDDCGNSTIKSNIYTIYDNSAPTAVCDEHTQVVIGVDGTARVEAFVFDDGSNDNCAKSLTYEVRRMNSNCDPLNQSYRDTISFCCDDIGTTQMVEMRVSDGTHTNSCMVEVNVLDKIPPVIKCPNDKTLECTDDYLNLYLTGKAEAFDNCKLDTLYYEDRDNDIDQCNVGSLSRVWIAKDEHGHESQCVQNITIKDSDYNKFKYEDITWPSDTIFYNCVDNFDPSITGDISFENEDFCSMVAARFKDDTFNVVEGACTKILRHWEVIDWCNFDEAHPEYSTWNHTQVIMLNNTVAPTFTEDCETKTFCTYGKCKGNVTYTKHATDDCTDSLDLYWTYKIDFGNNGSWDTNLIHSNTIDDIFENGTYRVLWTVEDGCGNSSSCEEIFIIKDCKKPTPLCITELTTVTMDTTGMAIICAKDFNLGSNCYNCNTGSYDNCTPKEDLKYSFSTDITKKCITYDCDDIPNGVSIQKILKVWVTDNEGNQDYCTVVVNIEDNEASVCHDTIVGSTVNGLVYSPKHTALDKVKLYMEGAEGTVSTAQTNNNGSFVFNNLNEDKTYTMSAELNTNFALGVTTLDIVLIQKHLLGIKKFDKPYKYIAADVNNSRTISANDLLRIRKLILGENKDFGNSTNSWGFIEEGDDIRNNENILSTWKNNDIEINSKSFNKSNNIVGIKIGDVSGNSDDLLHGNNLAFRNNVTTPLVAQNELAVKNQEINTTFAFSNINDIEGAQFTLNFDPKKLTFLELTPNDNLISMNSFGLSNVANGYVTISWAKPNNLSSTDISELFTITFKAKKSGAISSMISLSSDITTIEAYDNNFETMGINLQFRDNESVNENFALYQNTPNPFSDETTILFDLPSSQNASISFYDVTGRTVKTISKEFAKGTNSITVSFDKLVSGVIYYTLKTDEYTATKKMINLK